MDFTAKLIQINEPVTGEGKNGPWKRQEFIFETESQYPRKICVSVWGDRAIQDPSIMQIGNVLNVAFDLESREFNGRWYTDVRPWRISLPGTQAAPANFAPQGGYQTPAAPAAPAAASPVAPEFPAAPAGNDAADDLPF
ncbi:MAG: DUF3127 domain-containing protein [Bacteroidales bacterium]|nr:DUF3127 domain-containing protein [Bacteroidales bacterium]MDE7072358.1 DUF3127 domain-containing protein [Bacteroidales bacterium]